MQDKIGIIGLGLIGGSLAKALRHKAKVSVVALDRDQAVLEQALNEGVLDDGALLPADFLVSAQSYAIFASCSVVFVCLPVDLVAPVVEQVGKVCPGIITDVGSVKTPILAEVTHPRFIGGHPLAGSERQGYSCSSAKLFENAIYVLVPQNASPERDVAALASLIRRIDAIPLVLDADEHDRSVAAISYLPHVVASALVQAALFDKTERKMELAAGGFRDITRIASADPQLWAGISRQSRTYLLPLIARQISLLEKFSALLEKEDETDLKAFFSNGAKLRQALPEGGSGALVAGASFTVEVSDQPGVLGRIATVLGDQDINIRNLHIRNARQYEGGQLTVWLYDAHLLPKARAVLEEAGYVCE